eukprot:6884575-Pyramimonas_sp.AAC.1
MSNVCRGNPCTYQKPALKRVSFRISANPVICQDKGRAQAIGVDFSEAQAILSAFIGEAQSQHVRVGSTLACRIRQAR